MRLIVWIAAFFALLTAPGVWAEEDFLDAESRARRSHELASSDVIYEQENFKALYYQNQAIIDLLKEIRDEMHSINVRAAQEKSGE